MFIGRRLRQCRRVIEFDKRSTLTRRSYCKVDDEQPAFHSAREFQLPPHRLSIKPFYRKAIHAMQLKGNPRKEGRFARRNPQ